jgi:hypothetical protein
MKITKNKCASLTFAIAIVAFGSGIANAQIQAAGGGYYRAGYPTVYGSFGQASSASGRLYDTMRSQKTKTAERNASIKRSGRVTPGPSRPSKNKTASSRPVIRNNGVFSPDPRVDTGKILADNLGNTPEEKQLIKQIYTATKTAYEKEAAARGWKNNIAAGMTFFTITAMTVYHDTEEPSDEAVNNYFEAVNTALNEMPEFANVANKDKQGFNNMLIGFSGIMLAAYTEAKQANDPEALETSKKLAAMLIELILKTDPENILVENGQIVTK